MTFEDLKRPFWRQGQSADKPSIAPNRQAFFAQIEDGKLRLYGPGDDRAWLQPTLPSTNIQLSTLGAVEPLTLQVMQDLIHSSGWVEGGEITENGDGTIDIAAGAGLIRSVDDNTAELFYFEWEAATGVSLTDEATNWVYVDYNAGTPIVTIKSALQSDYNTQFPLARIFRSGTDLHVNEGFRHSIGDHASLMMLSMRETMPFARANGAGGVISDAGSLQFDITSAKFWYGLTPLTFGGFSAGSTFGAYYRDGSGGWNEVDATTINNTQYDNGSGTLATISNNKFVVHWVYIAPFDDDVSVVFSQSEYNQLSDAEAANPPSTLPPSVQTDSKLIGRLILEKSATEFSAVYSVFDTTFSATGGSAASDHEALSGLLGGTTNEHYHFTAAEHTALQLWSAEDPSNYALVGHNHDGAYAPLSHAHSGADITSGTVAAGRLPLLTSTASGIVTAYGSSSTVKFLRANGTWGDPLWQITDVPSGEMTYYDGNVRIYGHNLEIGTIATTQDTKLTVYTKQASSGNNVAMLELLESNTIPSSFGAGTFGVRLYYDNTSNLFHFATVDGNVNSDAFTINRSNDTVTFQYDLDLYGLPTVYGTDPAILFDNTSFQGYVSLSSSGDGLTLGSAAGVLIQASGSGLIRIVNSPDQVQIVNPALSGTISGPFATSTVPGLVPATGTPSGKFLKDDGTWASPSAGSSLWTLSGSDIYYTGGNVGVGTSSPAFNLQVGDYAGSSAVLGIVSASGSNSYIYLREVDANYGFSIGYEGTPNNFVIKRHNGSASGDVVFQIPRTSNDIYIGGPLTLMNGDNSTGSNNKEQIFFGYNGTTTYRHAIKSRHYGSGAAGNALDFYLWTTSSGANTNEPAYRCVTFDGDGSYIFSSPSNYSNGPNIHLNNYQGSGYTSLLFTSGSAGSIIQGSILFGPGGSNNIRIFGGASSSNPVLVYNSSQSAWVPNSTGARWGYTSLGWHVHYTTLTNVSDARVKKNIRPSRGLEFIMNLKPYMFEYEPYTVQEDEQERLVDQQGTYAGFVAQDLTGLVDPEEVVIQYDKENDFWGMDITQLIAPLVQAMQDQQKMIEALQAQVEALLAQ